MVYRLLATLTSSGVIIFLLMTGDSLAKEYVFSAPEELDQESAEIPASDQDYPMFDCGSTSDDQENPMDSHNCECIDCENTSQSESERPSTSENPPLHQE